MPQRILNIGTRLQWSASRPASLTPRESRRYRWFWTLWRREESLPRIKPRFLGYQLHSLFIYGIIPIVLMFTQLLFT
jgi:hypothetical protein